MNSTPDLKANEADDALAARADERLAHAYKQIADADDQLARLTEHLSRMEHDDLPRREPLRGGSALRGLIGLLSAACIIVAAFVSQSSYGDAAKEVISRWAPPLISPQWSSSERSVLPGQPGSSAVRAAMAEAAAPEATASIRTAAQDVAPPPVDVTQMMHEMFRVLANVQQGVEQLKAGQEQMASDNAKVVEQLKASQEQMTRLLARTSEPSPPPKMSEPSLAPKASAPGAAPKASSSAPLPRPSPTSKPVWTRSPTPQARAQPRAPAQSTPEEQ
jgi:hypothetical protein